MTDLTKMCNTLDGLMHDWSVHIDTVTIKRLVDGVRERDASILRLKGALHGIIADFNKAPTQSYEAEGCLDSWRRMADIAEGALAKERGETP